MTEPMTGPCGRQHPILDGCVGCRIEALERACAVHSDWAGMAESAMREAQAQGAVMREALEKQKTTR